MRTRWLAVVLLAACGPPDPDSGTSGDPDASLGTGTELDSDTTADTDPDTTTDTDAPLQPRHRAGTA